MSASTPTTTADAIVPADATTGAVPPVTARPDPTVFEVPPTSALLEDDLITIPGQAFALLSVVSPTSNQKSQKCGIKIRGVFGSRPEADSHARKLQRMDPTFDIYLVDMYKWLVIPPDPTAIDDHQYAEGYLNDLFNGYRENQVLARQHFEERKRGVQQDGLDQHLLPDERQPEPPHATEMANSASAEAEPTPAAA